MSQLRPYCNHPWLEPRHGFTASKGHHQTCIPRFSRSLTKSARQWPASHPQPPSPSPTLVPLSQRPFLLPRFSQRIVLSSTIKDSNPRELFSHSNLTSILKPDRRLQFRSLRFTDLRSLLAFTQSTLTAYVFDFAIASKHSRVFLSQRQQPLLQARWPPTTTTTHDQTTMLSSQDLIMKHHHHHPIPHTIPRPQRRLPTVSRHWHTHLETSPQTTATLALQPLHLPLRTKFQSPTP